VGGDENHLPVEILRLLSDWFANLEERMTVPGTSLGAMIEYVSVLEDSLSGVSAFTFTSLQHGSCVTAAERTLTTPLPLCVGLIPFATSSSSDDT
jgi:hypothetical protein